MFPALLGLINPRSGQHHVLLAQATFFPLMRGQPPRTRAANVLPTRSRKPAAVRTPTVIACSATAEPTVARVLRVLLDLTNLRSAQHLAPSVQPTSSRVILPQLPPECASHVRLIRWRLPAAKPTRIVNARAAFLAPTVDRACHARRGPSHPLPARLHAPCVTPENIRTEPVRRQSRRVKFVLRTVSRRKAVPANSAASASMTSRAQTGAHAHHACCAHSSPERAPLSVRAARED